MCNLAFGMCFEIDEPNAGKFGMLFELDRVLFPRHSFFLVLSLRVLSEKRDPFAITGPSKIQNAAFCLGQCPRFSSAAWN